MKKLGIAVALALLFALTTLPQSARADSLTGTISLTNCGPAGTSCPPATYTFDVNAAANTATLTIAIASGAIPVTGTNGNYQIEGVDLGFTNGSADFGTLDVTGPNSGWTAYLGPLGSTGCGDKTSSFICASGVLDWAAGTSYKWTWTWTGNVSADTYTNLSEVHVGADYGPKSGQIVSETGAVPYVPEPGSLLLLGSSLLGLAFWGRKRLGKFARPEE
jgi:hypothetical protein